MEAEIVPEPSGQEREALLAALAELDGSQESPAYASSWRRAGFPGEDEDEPG